MNIAEKRAELNKKEQSQKDMLTLAYYLKQSSVDFTPKLNELSKSISSSISGLKDDSLKTELKQIADEYKQISVLMTKYQEQQTKALSEALEGVSKALIDLNSKEVKVDAGKLDTEPLVQAIKEIVINVPESKVSVEMGEKELELEGYRASDLKDEDTIQYIGFIHPEGKWYIVENNTEKNSLRYVFGDKNYKSAFKKAGTWEYKILSEAINAV